MTEFFPTWQTRSFKNQKLTASQKRQLLELYAKADNIREKAAIEAELEWQKIEWEIDEKLNDVF